MKKYILSICIALGGLLASCSDDIDLVIPHATNITFSELEIPTRFSHVIPDGGFSVEGIHFNTVKSSDGQLSGGFCYSNRSNRSFVWQNTPEAIDSIRYSVWTTRPNNTGVYLVCHVNDDDASFTFDEPSVIDYILVANTSWAYLAMYYGDTYAGEDGEPVANPNIPSKPMGIWHSYVPGGVTKFADGRYRLQRRHANGNGRLRPGLQGRSQHGQSRLGLHCEQLAQTGTFRLGRGRPGSVPLGFVGQGWGRRNAHSVLVLSGWLSAEAIIS